VVAQSAPALDLSSPKSTIAAMFAAVHDADATALKRTFLADTTETSDLSSSYADLVVATRRLREAARTKFNSDGGNLAMARDGTTPGKAPPEQAAQLAAAQVQMDGDQATVTIPDRAMPIKLKRVDGAWLIDLADFAAGTPQQIGEQAELDRNLAAALKEAADEITAGRYASAQEAESAVQQKIHAVITPAIKSLPPTSTSKP
jgi:hypothetical protein